MKLYTAKELAGMCKVSIGTVYRLGREKKLRTVRVGRSVRFALPEMEDGYAERNTEEEQPA